MLSGQTTTTTSSFPRLSSWMAFTAASMALPLDPPHRIPSSAISRLAYWKAVRSSVLYHLSTTSWLRTSGMKSYPIPSTLYPSFMPSWFNVSGSAKILPLGSAAMILMSFLCL